MKKKSGSFSNLEKCWININLIDETGILKKNNYDFVKYMTIEELPNDIEI